MSAKNPPTLQGPGNFFLVVPPPFEELAQQELKEKWPSFFGATPIPAIQVVKGGLELETSLRNGFLLNPLLKIPNRILWRVAEFTCRDFPNLFKKIKKIPWRFYLSALPELDITCRKSGLTDHRKIIKAIHQGIEESFRHQPPQKSTATATLFVRLAEETCTLSMDTSGERLGIRGYKKFQGMAPLRENLAAALVYLLQNECPGQGQNLVDPLCGSGTILLESALFHWPNTARTYAYQSFPFCSTLKIPKIDGLEGLFRSYLGQDRDLQIISWAKENCQNTVIPPGLVLLEQKDLFTPLEKELPQDLAIITNPPYGERFSLKNPQHFFPELIETLLSRWRPKVMGIILPRPWANKIKLPDSYQKVRILSFSHGGTDVQFLIVRPLAVLLS